MGIRTGGIMVIAVTVMIIFFGVLPNSMIEFGQVWLVFGKFEKSCRAETRWANCCCLSVITVRNQDAPALW